MNPEIKKVLADRAAEEIRAQRRYEIARDCLAGMMAGEDEINGYYTTENGVARAIEFADALLDALAK